MASIKVALPIISVPAWRDQAEASIREMALIVGAAAYKYSDEVHEDRVSIRDLTTGEMASGGSPVDNVAFWGVY